MGDLHSRSLEKVDSAYKAFAFWKVSKYSLDCWVSYLRISFPCQFVSYGFFMKKIAKRKSLVKGERFIRWMRRTGEDEELTEFQWSPKSRLSFGRWKYSQRLNFLGLSSSWKTICPLSINIFCLKLKVLPCDCFQILNLSSFCKYQLSESNLIFFHSAKKTWHRNARTFPNTLFRYRFSAFWLRSKCSICSYQLNIWYEDHVSSRY